MPGSSVRACKAAWEIPGYLWPGMSFKFKSKELNFSVLKLVEEQHDILEPVKEEVLAKWLLHHAKLYEGWPSRTVGQPGEPIEIPVNWYQLHQKAVDDYCPGFRVLYKIETLEQPIDSSKMTPDQWFDIAKRIEEVQEGFDGFVILHGTDTMAYTASALSFILRDLKKPVILTGAQRTIFHPRSDAVGNFIGAMLIASCFSTSKLLQRVMLFADTKLFQGNRVRKHDCDSFSIFDSPNVEALVKLKAMINDQSLPVVECHPLAEQKCETIRVRASKPGKFPDVRLLKFFPGIKAQYLSSILSEADGLVLETFGSGNVPGDPELIKVLTDADKNGVILMNCTQVYRGTVQPIYDTNSPLWKAVVPGYDITPEAALAKMIWVLRMIPDHETRKKVLLSSICGESSAPPAELIFENGSEE